MSLFGVQLNVQLNRLILQIRQKISNSKTKVFLRDLQAGFHNYDTHGAGVIHIQNFQNVLQENRILIKKWQYQVFLKAFPAQAQKGYLFWNKFINAIIEPLSVERINLLNNIWDYINVRQQKGIHYQEFGNLLNVQKFIQVRDGFKSEAQLKNQMFHRFRFDQSGFITKQQYINFYQYLNCNFPGQTSFREFVASHWNFPLTIIKLTYPQEVKALVREFRFKLIQKTNGTHQQFLLKEVFEQFDRQKQGCLSVNDLHYMSSKLDIPLEQRLLQPLFTRFDRNGSGFIEYNEFKNFLFFDPYPI